MKQSRLASLLESCGNTASGFFLSLLAQSLFLPAIGVEISLRQNFIFACFMTLVSVARSFCWRRLMEAIHVRRALTPAMHAVIAERYRQIEAEGWSTEHDDQHPQGELEQAAAAYALVETPLSYDWKVNEPPPCWPWDAAWWKPGDKRRNLVRAGALILAAIERFDRMKHKPSRVLAGEPR